MKTTLAAVAASIFATLALAAPASGVRGGIEISKRSGDGNVLIVGVPTERSTAADDAPEIGAVYLYRRVDGTWREERRFAPAPGALPAHYGSQAEISDDGNTILIGRETAGGTAEIYTHVDGTWQLTATIPGPGDQTGCNHIRLSGDGRVVARTCARPPYYQALQMFRGPTFALDVEDNLFRGDDIRFAELEIDHSGDTVAWSQVGTGPGVPVVATWQRRANGDFSRVSRTVPANYRVIAEMPAR